MTIASIDTVERSIHKTNEWLANLTDQLGREDRDEAWRILCGYLHVLRDRLTIEEGAHLAAQLPHRLRGVFYESFQLARPPERVRDRDALLARLAEEAALAGPTDASRAAEAATRTLRCHVSGGEVDDVLAQLPERVRHVLEPD